MNQIAHRAEFTIGALYRFFKNKEDLYHALLVDTAEQFHSALSEVLDAKEECRQKIKNYIRFFGELFMANARAIRLYFAETFGVSFNLRAALTQELQAYHDDILNRLKIVFSEGIRKGVCHGIDPYSMALVLNSMLYAFFFQLSI